MVCPHFGRTDYQNCRSFLRRPERRQPPHVPPNNRRPGGNYESFVTTFEFFHGERVPQTDNNLYVKSYRSHVHSEESIPRKNVRRFAWWYTPTGPCTAQVAAEFLRTPYPEGPSSASGRFKYSFYPTGEGISRKSSRRTPSFTGGTSAPERSPCAPR